MTGKEKQREFRRQMRIGANLANQLPQLMGAKEVADALGLSDTKIRQIECLALYKLYERIAPKELDGTRLESFLTRKPERVSGLSAKSNRRSALERCQARGYSEDDLDASNPYTQY